MAIADTAATPAAPIDWKLPLDSAQHFELAAWCATVGPAVVVPRAGGREPSDLDSLAVVTWNTHTGGGGIAELVAELRSGKVTGAPVRHFVLLLQEAYRAGAAVPAVPRGTARIPGRSAARPPSGSREDIVESARRLGLELYYVPSMHNGYAPTGQPPEDRGNAILSTVPLEDLVAVELPVEAQRRVAAVATVRGRTSRGAEWTLRVMDVHLDNRSSRADRLRESTGPGRRRQIEALLAEAPVPEAPIDRPTVLAGDLNTWADRRQETALSYLTDVAGFVYQPLPPGRPTFVKSFGYNRHLDHIFFRLPEGWTARSFRLDSRYGSDHYPLLGWVQPSS